MGLSHTYFHVFYCVCTAYITRINRRGYVRCACAHDIGWRPLIKYLDCHNTQQPIAHKSSEPDLVELPKISHDKPNKPRPTTDTYTSAPLIRPKKRSDIIQQQGLLDQFSLSPSLLMISEWGSSSWLGLPDDSRQRLSEH